MAKRDYYEILGVEKGSDKDTIKKAYRKLAMQYHPDKNPGDKAAEEKFKEAAEAYDVLGDDQKRARYDQFGHAGMGGGGGGAQYQDINDIFNQFGDIFGGTAFESFFGNGGGGGRARSGGRRRGQRGNDLRVKVKLNLEEIAAGVKKNIRIRRHKPCQSCNGIGAFDSNSFQTCPTCNGYGEIRQQVGGGFFQQIVVQACPTCQGEGRIITKACKVCNGEGRQQEEDSVSLNIPAGVAEGMQLSMRGYGNAGLRGGDTGDLLIQIEEEKHPHLVREGDNVLYELFISISDAALGTSVEVPTLTGKARFKVEPGTQSGKMVRLKGKGIPHLNNYGSGDQLVQINVWTPTQLSNQEKEILQKLQQSPNFQPSPGKSDKGFFDRMREFFN